MAAGPLGLDAAWPAAAGALLMHAPSRAARARAIGARHRPPAARVRARTRADRAARSPTHGLGDLVTDVLPDGHELLALLGATALAAVLANLLNNVPALLVLLPAAAAAGPETVLAVLIGVNAGPNLTYTGSLATLLWRGALRDRGAGARRTRSSTCSAR